MIFQENKLNILKEKIEQLKSQWKTIVWTNGCFDILHPGHLETFKIWKGLKSILKRSEERKNYKKEIAKNDKNEILENDVILIVWLNWDKSPYWKTKPGRPINDENFRAKMLEWIKYIDFVYIFNDETPAKVVDILKPDIVLKGGDYYIKRIPEDKYKDLSEDEIWRLSEDSKDNNHRQSEYQSQTINKWNYHSSSFPNHSTSIKKFNEIVETQLIKRDNGIIDITGIYKYFLENDLVEIVSKIKWFMPEWLVSVKNWWRVVLVPTVEWYSTTNIVEKIIKKYCN